MNPPVMPSHLPPLPKGAVYLGKGSTFERLPKSREFKGWSFHPYTDKNWGGLSTWEGSVYEMHYAARVNSAIHKVQPWYRPQTNADPKGEAGKLKTPMQLIPPAFEQEVAKALGNGAERYRAWNWRESDGVEAQTYVGAIKRHLNAWQAGEECAEDSGISHLAHAAASLAILMDAQLCGKLIDNRPKNPNKEEG